MRRIVAIAGLLLLAILVGCGDSASGDEAKIAFEEAEAVPVGRSVFIKLAPQTQSPEQRRILAEITGGRWLQNGLFILAAQADADCRAKILTVEICAARPSPPVAGYELGP